LRDFEHERPVRTGTSGRSVDRGREGRIGGLNRLERDILLRAVVRRVVGEDSSTVEGAIILGAIEKEENVSSKFAKKRAKGKQYK